MGLDVASIAGPVRPAGAEARQAPRPAALGHPALREPAGEPIAECPPREVLDAIEAAARWQQRLDAEGREVRFSRDPVSGRVAAELRDCNGRLLRTISTPELLDAITTGSLD